MPFREQVSLPDGSTYVVTKLLGKGDGNAKLLKSNQSGLGYTTVGLSLAPANLSGYEMCKGRSKGCTAACLNTAGRGQMNSVQKARVAKTILLHEKREVFINRLFDELDSADHAAHKEGNKLAVRLNVVSDYPWEEEFPNIFSHFSNVQFYDYTKILKRAKAFAHSRYYSNHKLFPRNYHLTFSRSESNSRAINEILQKPDLWPINIAVVFQKDHIPVTWEGRSVINGDTTDLRFLDDEGVIVGLYAKGKGKKDATGFVISLPMV